MRQHDGRKQKKRETKKENGVRGSGLKGHFGRRYGLWRRRLPECHCHTGKIFCQQNGQEKNNFFLRKKSQKAGIFRKFKRRKAREKEGNMPAKPVVFGRWFVELCGGISLRSGFYTVYNTDCSNGNCENKGGAGVWEN